MRLILKNLRYLALGAEGLRPLYLLLKQDTCMCIINTFFNINDIFYIVIILFIICFSLIY